MAIGNFITKCRLKPPPTLWHEKMTLVQSRFTKS
ncbi:hypothetical protein OROMI_027534 [Orobanche minor]